MNKNGQSMIEYSLIAFLVVVGVVVMGPYALRSVGAHFKLWDESVQDSISENITQAPVGDAHITSNCPPCTNTKTSCGSSLAGSQCSATQMGYAHTCNPQFCDGAPASFCLTDSSCCTGLSASVCGNIPLGQPQTTSDCNYGNRLYSQQCGASSSSQCQPDASCPMPQCQGILGPGVQPCPNSPGTSLGGSLSQNYALTYVSGVSACTGIACQYYCDSSQGYFINASGTACTNVFTVAPAVHNCSQNGACTQNLTSLTNFNCNSTSQGRGWATTVNTCSFELCDSNAKSIAIGSITDISQPESPPYCNNPGNPGEQCKVSVVY